MSGIRRVRAALLAALDSLFGEFLSAEVMDEFCAAWGCNLRTPKHTFSQNSLKRKVNTSFSLIGKIQTWVAETWLYLKSYDADVTAGVVVVVSTWPGVRLACAVVHSGTLTLPGCIPQTCSHVGQLFILQARTLHLHTEMQGKRKRQRDGDGAMALRTTVYLESVFSNGIHQHHPCKLSCLWVVDTALQHIKPYRTPESAHCFLLTCFLKMGKIFQLGKCL